MTKNNSYYEIPKTYTVSYFNETEWNKNLTLEELKQQELINESYHLENQAQGKGYGPCGDNDKCSCSCHWKSGCSCVWNYEKVGRKNGEWDEIVGKGSVRAGIGEDGAEVGFEDSKSLFRKKDNFQETNYLSSSAGGAINLGRDNNVSVKGKIGFDLVNYEETDGFKARVGVNLETGGSIGEDGVEIKFLGFGFSLGKKNEISTPFVGVSSNKDDECVVQ